MASWSGFMAGRPPTTVHVVYVANEDGALELDPDLEAALTAVKAKVTRGSVVDAIASPDLILLTHGAATGANMRAALEAALMYTRYVSVVTVGADRPSEMSLPSASEHEVSLFPPLHGVTYFTVSRTDFEPLEELRKALELYYAWASLGRPTPTPTFLPGRPRANDNFRTLAESAPMTAERSLVFATVITKDMFRSIRGSDYARHLIGRAFLENVPRELISSSLEPEDDLSDLFLDSGSDEQWSEEPPEEEEGPSRELVERFDTPFPSGVEIADRVNYYEFDTREVDKEDPITGEVQIVTVRHNCRSVPNESLRAIEPLDPESWKARTGGIPLISPAAIARYTADPKAQGTELVDVRDGERLIERVILDQTRHWSGKFGYAPASAVSPISRNIAGAFANVEIDDETGEVRLLRPIAKGEFLTVDYGEDFFGESAHPHFAIDAIVEIPTDPEEVIVAMMSHAWDAVEAVRLRIDRMFALQAAQVMATFESTLTETAFGLCANVVHSSDESASRDAIRSIFEIAESSKTKVLGDYMERVIRSVEQRSGSTETEDILEKIKGGRIKSEDPERLWEAAKDEWDQLASYLKSVQDSDPALHAQLNQMVVVLDEEAARVMNPRYNAMISLEPPRQGVDFVPPYTFEALLKAAQGAKRIRVEELRKLVRKAGLDPGKRVEWREAKRLALERADHLARLSDPAERGELEKLAYFWRGYPEFTVVDPGSQVREIVFSTEELFKIRDEEREHPPPDDDCGKCEEEKSAKKKGREEVEQDLEMEEKREEDERSREREVQDEERQMRREGERIEFDRLGRVMAELLADRGEAFDAFDYDTVSTLIVLLEGRYELLIEERWNERRRARWDKWKGLARDAYERTADGGYATTRKFPRFVKDATKILRSLEGYEARKHPRRLRKVLVDLGMEAPLEKKRKKKKGGARIKKSVSPAKESSPVKSVARSSPSPGSASYSNASIFEAVSAIVPRARSDAVFFFYGTRSEGLVQQFEAVFADATVLHKPGLGGEGGVASPDEVHARVTHFFVLYDGDEDTRRWYERMPRDTSWPYLVATEEIQRRVDPEARRVSDASTFEMVVGGKTELFALYRRTEIVVIDE